MLWLLQKGLLTILILCTFLSQGEVTVATGAEI